MSSRTVTDQAGLDAALAESVERIYIDSPAGVWLSVEARESSHVVAWESSHVVARGSSHVVARGSSHVVAWESSHVVAWGSSHVEAWGSSHVEARESSHVEAWESSHVVAWESSHVEARGSSHVEARESSHVEAWESSHVVARGSSHVEAWGSSHVVAWESSHVVAWGSSHVVATACVAVHLHSASAEVSGGVIIDLTTLDLANLETWRGYIGADTLVDAKREQLVVGEVSSQRHPGRLNKSGLITIGCWAGSVEDLRELAVADEWPSGASAATRSRFSPRLLACADLCEQQLAAWASVEAVAR